MMLAFAALIVFALVQMVMPFVQSRQDQARFDLLGDETRKIDDLVALKALYLDHLREIEMDHELEKISPEDYARLKRQNERAAVGVMRKLDAFYGGHAWRGDVDEMIAAFERDHPSKPSQPALAHAASGPSAPSAGQAPLCSACGALQTDPNPKFCSSCGATLSPSPPRLVLLGTHSPS